MPLTPSLDDDDDGGDDDDGVAVGDDAHCPSLLLKEFM